MPDKAQTLYAKYLDYIAKFYDDEDELTGYPMWDDLVDAQKYAWRMIASKL